MDVLADEIWRPGVDALFLQEADAEAPPHAGVLSIAAVEHLTGLRHLHDSPSARFTAESHGFLGNVIFLHPGIEVEALRLIDLPGVHPRGAVVVDVAPGGHKLRLVTTHLGLAQVLRLAQLRTIAQHLARCDPRPVILCGDLNEWRPWGGLALSARLLGLSLTGPAPATFPVGFPLLPLDRLLTTHPSHVEAVEVLNGPGIRMASDHRPILGRVRLR